MAFVIDEYTAFVIIMVVAFIGGTVNKQGGLKIVLWRMRGVKWFLFTYFPPDGNTIRIPMKQDKIHHSVLPKFDTKYGTFFAGGPNNTRRIFGGPQWLYNWDDSRPLDLDRVGEKFSPQIIADAYHDETVAKFNMLKQPIGSKFKWGIFGFVIALILILGIVNIVYSYYFGVNLNCALHTRVCP